MTTPIPGQLATALKTLNDTAADCAQLLLELANEFELLHHYRSGLDEGHAEIADRIEQGLKAWADAGEAFLAVDRDTRTLSDLAVEFSVLASNGQSAADKLDAANALYDRAAFLGWHYEDDAQFTACTLKASPDECLECAAVCILRAACILRAVARD